LLGLALVLVFAVTRVILIPQGEFVTYGALTYATLSAGPVPGIGRIAWLSGALTAEPLLSLVYFDAHGDFNTMATTPSHYISGMVLAHLCGRSVAPLLFPGARKIADDRVALVGARALDSGEIANLDRSRVLRIAFDREHPEAPGLVAWTRRRSVWLHVDVDVIDPREFPAVAFAAVGGPPMKDFAFVLRQVFAVADVRGISICGYDARADQDHALAAPLADAVASAFGRVPVRA